MYFIHFHLALINVLKQSISGNVTYMKHDVKVACTCKYVITCGLASSSIIPCNKEGVFRHKCFSQPNDQSKGNCLGHIRGRQNHTLYTQYQEILFPSAYPLNGDTRILARVMKDADESGQTNQTQNAQSQKHKRLNVQCLCYYYQYHHYIKSHTDAGTIRNR